MNDRSSKRSNLIVVVTACLFLLCDTAVLALGYHIARQVEADAVTINLAGRQRMLSQRMVKALLQVYIAEREGTAAAAELAELDNAVTLFDRTLDAFAVGGQVRGGDGMPVDQHPIDDAAGSRLVRETLTVWRPYRALLDGLTTAAGPERRARLGDAVAMASTSNLPLLDLANRLTTHVEAVSRHRTERLRVLQVTAFLFALVNFAVMLHSIWRRVRGLHSRHAEMHSLARRDALTGLANRTRLIEHLQHAFETVDGGHGVAVGYLDLNGFKQVNDTHGHVVGDRLLCEAADRLAQRLRNSDLIARIGGDEFVVVLHDVRAERDVGPVMESLVETLRRPFTLGGVSVDVGVSIGVVLVRTPDAAVEDVIAYADRLMYRVKRGSSNGWMVEALAVPRAGTVEMVAVGRA